MKTLLILSVICLGACGEAYDPTGNYSLATTWGSGDCDIAGTDNLSFTVTESNGAYLFASSEFDTLTGTVTCSEDCDISITATKDLSDADFPNLNGSSSFNLNVADAKVTGNGSISVSGDISCSQQFAATGTHQ